MDWSRKVIENIITSMTENHLSDRVYCARASHSCYTSPLGQIHDLCWYLLFFPTRMYIYIYILFIHSFVCLSVYFIFCG